MSRTIKLLLAEDSPDDAELVLRVLKRAGLETRHERVESAAAMAAALERQEWDAVISDYNIPGFGGLEALRIVRARDLDIPFILISGTVGEEIAVDAMKAGANDYVVKANLPRLALVLERELKEAAIRAEHRLAQHGLVESELRYRELFMANPHPMWLYDQESLRFLGVNDAAIAQYGWSREEFLAMTIAEIRPAEEVQRVLSQLSREMGGGIFESGLWKHKKKDGTIIDVEITSHPIEFDRQRARLVLAHDVTARLAAERKLREGEAELRRFRLALDNSADIILIIDRATMRHVDVNQTACRLLGYSREELLRMQPKDILPVDQGGLEKKYDDLIANPSQPSGMRSYYVCKDGSHLPFESTRHVLRSGDTWLIAAISRDIRLRLTSEQALRESEAVLRRAQAVAKLAHVITGPDGSFETWSETLPRMIGVRSSGMPRSTRAWLDWIHPQDRAGFRARAIAAERTGKRTEFAYRLKCADGSWIHIKQVSEPLDGTPDAPERMRWIGTLLDVTHEKLTGAELQASEERHRALFERAAVGIVHASLEGQMLLVNPKFCDLTGYSRAEVIQLTIRDLTHPEDVQQGVNGRAQLLTEPGRPYARELRLLRKDRSELWVHVTTSVMHAQEGRPSHFISVVSDISERKRTEQEVHRFRAAMDVTIDSIYLTDPATMRFLYVNETACRRLGYPREQLLQKTSYEVVGKTREQVGREYDEVIAAGEQGMRHESEFVRSDGSRGWTELHRRALRTAGGDLIVTIGRDITERKAQQDRIERLSRVHAVLSGINAAIVRTSDRNELFREACRVAIDAGKFKFAWLCLVEEAEQRLVPVASAGRDDGFLRTVGTRFSLRDDAPGGHGVGALAVREKRAVVVNDVETDPAIEYKQEHARRGIRSVAVLPLLVGGRAIGALGLHSGEVGFFDDEEMRLLNELAGDVAFALEHIEKAEKLNYLALYDPLTGLANRSLMVERLGQSIHAAGQTGAKFALALLDIERLTTINESLGRQAGDAIIRQVAERVRRSAGPNAAARITADQFAAVLPAVSGRSEAGRVAADFARACFAEPFRVEGNELHLAAKAGLSLFPNDGIDAETLLGNAEAALRKAKETGERQVFYTPDLTERTGATLTLENKLRRALEKDEFVLHYQPKVDLETRRIAGVEALIRWQSPELGLVPPMKFIPLMEETGMILDVGAWALKRASLDHRNWTEARLTPPRVAVNVSAIQLRQRDFVANVEQAIVGGVAPTAIDLEITESLIMEDVEGNIEKLKAVRALGVSIAIDDFGTGYSSLSYLAKLPVQMLKIDRSFIITMLNDPDTMTLVQTIISLAHSLRLKVVAEGVDSEDQAKILRLLRCDELQGYLFSKPVPVEQMTALLKQGK